jgi:ATP/maltotriose-dependent transcriptional regulator MalT
LKQLDAFAETAHALSLLGRLAWMTGDFEIAKQAYRDSVALAEETNDLVTLGFGYLNLSMISVIEGNFQQSSQLKQTGLTTFQQINHQLGIGIILCIKGEELYLLGHYQQAKDYVLRASDIFVELDNRWHLSNCYENLGHIMFALGNNSEALQHLGMAMTLAQETNDPRRITHCQVKLGDVLYACGRIDEANQSYSESLVLSRKAHQRLQEAWSLRGLGAIAYHNSNYEIARQYSFDSLNISRETGWKMGAIKALNLQGLVAKQLGDMENARGYFLEALDTAILINANPANLETLVCIADMLIALNDRQSAMRILSDCGQHVAIHAELKNRLDYLLSELSDHLPPDVFVGLKHRSQLPDTNALAAKWQHQLQYIVPSDNDEPLLEQLTRTERRVLMLMDSELSYPEIAELQHVSINTIKTHRKNIYTKLGVNTREEAVERAKNLRLL